MFLLKTSSAALAAVVLIVLVIPIPARAGVITHVAPEGEHNSAPTLSKIIKDSYITDALFEHGLKAANLSDSCSRHVMQLWEQLMNLIGDDSSRNSTGIETWALQMFDAWGKIPEGILSGHINALGDFDECLAVRGPRQDVNPFQGKYCLIYAVPKVGDQPLAHHSESQQTQSGERSIENLLKLLSVVGNAELPLIPSLGSCLPSSCADEEVFKIVSILLTNINLLPITTFCSTDEAPKIGGGAIATMSLLGVLLTFVIVGTCVDLAVIYHFLPTPNLSNKLFLVCKAFSLATNGKKFMSTESTANDVSCLHGIRFLSASWVVLGHTYLMGIIQPLWNIVDTYSMITTSISILFVTNAAIVVDVFFVIGGFLVSLTLLAMLEKTRGNMRSMPMVYLHRYLRITPMYMIIVAFATFVFPLMGSGPYWHITKTWAGFCEKNWWKNLLYINNLPIYDTVKDPLDAPCHGMAWYLGVDMQLFLLSPLLLFPIWKWKRFGVVPLTLLTIASIIAPGVITYVNDYPPTNVPFQSPTKRYSQEAYTPTYMRAAPYLIGMWAGIFFRKMRKLTSKKNYRLNSAQVIGAWLIAFTTGFAVLLSPHRYMDPEYAFQRAESAVFASGQRAAWASAISWLIFACASGYGGWINQILSWRPFIPLGRLTFAIYLVSMNLQFLFHLQYRQPIYFSNYHMVNLYFAHLVMSCLVALVCTLFIEAPFMQLLKILLPTAGKRKISKTCSNNNEIIKGELPRNSVSPDPSGRQVTIGSSVVSTLSANSREVLIHT